MDVDFTVQAGYTNGLPDSENRQNVEDDIRLHFTDANKVDFDVAEGSVFFEGKNQYLRAELQAVEVIAYL